MRNLHIVDVSATLHVGCYSFSDNNSHGFPTGGIFNTLRVFSGKGFDPKKDQVLFCFDRKTRVVDENGESTGYKEGRKSWNSKMYFQAKLLEEMLDNCGFYTFKQFDRESDEGILAYADKYLKDFEHVYIYGTDRDLAMAVTPKSTLVSISSKVPDVTYENFDLTVVPGEYVPYNAIALYKIFRKDQSDSIRGGFSPIEFQELVRELENAKFPMHRLNTREALEFVINRYKCDDKYKAKLWDNYNLVMPREVELIHDLTVPAPINHEMLDRYCSALSLSLFCKKYNGSISGEVDQAWYKDIIEFGQIVKEDLLEEHKNDDKPFKLPKDYVPKYFNIVDKPCEHRFFETYYED